MHTSKIIFIVLFLFINGIMSSIVLANDETTKMFSYKYPNFSLVTEVKATDKFVRLKHLMQTEIEDFKYSELLICKRPLKGKPLTLTKDYLERLFLAKGVDSDTLYLMEIPQEVKVFYSESNVVNKKVLTSSTSNAIAEKNNQIPLTEIDSSEILLRVSNAIDMQLRSNNPQISIYHPNANSNWKVRVPEDYDLKILPGLIIKSNSVSAKIGVYYKNEFIDAKVFNFKADIFIKSFVAKVNIDKGQMITKDMFGVKMVPYSLDALNYIRDEKLVVGFESQKNIKAGEGVESSDIDTPVIVSRGASIKILIKDHGFSIRTVGIAQEAGRIGDQIQVLIKSSDTKIKGTVTGNNTVDIIN